MTDDGSVRTKPRGPPRGERRGGGRGNPQHGERRKPSHREGRKRYVAIRLLGRRPSRAELADLLATSLGGKGVARLTYYEGEDAVVRCFAHDRDAVVAAVASLQGVDPSVSATALVTSGTIRKAKEAFAKV